MKYLRLIRIYVLIVSALYASSACAPIDEQEAGAPKQVSGLTVVGFRVLFPDLQGPGTPGPAIPSDDTPTDDTPTDDTPTDDTPTDDTPSDDTPSDDTPSDDTPTDDTPKDESQDPCTAAIDHLVSECGVERTRIEYTGVCSPHIACEARCMAKTSCAVLVENGGSVKEREHFNQCTLSCYAEGPASCNAAESYVQHCGHKLSSDWNEDGLCSAEEWCVSNCAVTTSCAGLVGKGLDHRSGEACVSACYAGGLNEGPLKASADYCRRYPQTAECEGVERWDAYCVRYPEATGCDDLESFCSLHPKDAYCVASGELCGEGSLRSECSGEPIASCPWQWNLQECAPQKVCEYFPESPYCLLDPACLQDPTSLSCLLWMIEAGYTRGGSNDTGWDDENWDDEDYDSFYCEYYPYSHECDPSATPCAEYPDSPECDDTYVPYCARYPADPACD